MDSPTPAPTPIPIEDSDPTYRPTTSPTSGPTTSPSLMPTPSPTGAPSNPPTPCMEGMVAFVRTQPACFRTEGETDFDIIGGETLSVIGVPVNSKEFEATLDIQDSEQATMELWTLDFDGNSYCLFGAAWECELQSSGTASNGIQIIVGNRQIYNDDRNFEGRTLSIPAVLEFATLRVTSTTSVVGIVHHHWNGILPCGDDIHTCVFPPTRGPTTSRPTPRPTESPTDSPVTSRPTFRPTTSPTSGPTSDPTLAPTDPTDCEPPMTRVDLNYPACFRTTSTTDFDLAPGARQIILFIPLNAQDFVAELNSDNLADLIWIDSGTQQEIIGKSSSTFGQGAGTYTYRGTTFTYSGVDRSQPIYAKLETVLVSLGTYVVVENNGNTAAVGQVTTTWNGLSPCGTISYCQMPPTDAPTTSPSSRPTTSPTVSPTLRPTTSRPTPRPTESPITSRPTRSPTTRPTSSPTHSPVTSRPTFRPTTSPTSGPTPTPTDSPTHSPTDRPTRAPTECPESMIAYSRQYPACFATSSTTSFNLAAGASQTILFIPLNAQDFEAEMRTTSGDADLVWSAASTITSNQPLGFPIVGTSDAEFSGRGTYEYQGMTLTYSGSRDMPETVSSPLVTVGTFMQVIAGSSGAAGTITLRWNGVSPCGFVSYCAMPPTKAPTDRSTRRPTTSRPTPAPTRSPTTSRPTFHPVTSRPTFKPSPSPALELTFTLRPSTCEMGDYMEKFDELTEEYEDLQDKCAMLQDDLEDLEDTCSRSVSSRDCNNCLISPKQRYTGSVPSSIFSLNRASALNMPMEYDTGYPGQTVYVSFNGEVYIYRPDLGSDQFQRTCVGSGLEAMFCDTSRVVCAGGDLYGSLEQVAAALKVSSARIDMVHPNCPTGCQTLDGTMMQHFESQDSDIDVSRICVYSDEYHYIEDDGTYTYTCVGYGLESEVCPAHKMVCVGFEETSGLPTYGWYGEQARAVKKAINEQGNVYPTCPGS